MRLGVLDAAAAVEDGLGSTLLGPVSSAGVNGKNPRNISRDLVRRSMQSLEFSLAPYSVEVIHCVRNTQQYTVGSAHVILPHELWAAISEHEKLHEKVIGSPTDWAEWWKRNASEPWFLEHPLRHDILRAPEMHCPYVIH